MLHRAASRRGLCQAGHDRCVGIGGLGVRSITSPQFGNQFDEFPDDHGIVERRLSRSKSSIACSVDQPRPVRTIGGQRIEAVDNGKNSGAERNFGADETVGIAAAVPLLVMVADDRHDWIREIDGRENAGAHAARAS